MTQAATLLMTVVSVSLIRVLRRHGSIVTSNRMVSSGPAKAGSHDVHWPGIQSQASLSVPYPVLPSDRHAFKRD